MYAHAREWRWRRFRHVCGRCGLPWPRWRARCLDAPRSPQAPRAGFDWNGPTTLITYALTRGQIVRGNRGLR
jgi:hypothetical protein